MSAPIERRKWGNGLPHFWGAGVGDSALSPSATLAADARADPSSAMVLAATNGQGRARSTRASEA